MRESHAPVGWVVGAIVYVVGLVAVGPLAGATPLTFLAQAVIDAAPGAVSTTAIELFGKAAQPLLVAGVAAALVLAAAGVGRLWSRLPSDTRDVRVWAVGLAVGTVAAFVGAAGPTPAAVAAGLLAVLPVVAARWAMTARERDGDRRTFLRRVGVAGLALVGAGGGAVAFDRATRSGGVQPGQSLADQRTSEKVSTGRTLASATATAVSESDSGAETGMGSAKEQPVEVSSLESDEPFGFDFPGMPARLTPVEDHYVVDKEVADPEIDAGDWSLNVGGQAVESTYNLSLEGLVGHPKARDQVVTLVCVSNPVGGPLVSTMRWRGVPLRALMEEAGIAGDAVDIVSQAADEYTESIPWEVVRDRPDIMVAYGMNGQTLPRPNGFPARLLIPGRYGMKSTKWLVGVGAVRSDFQGYWEERGWEEKAAVNTLSYIRAAQRRGDRVAVGGIAFAGIRGIERVEVSLDGGDTWQTATLDEPLSPFARRRWRYVTSRPEGTIEAVVRAVDGTGTRQTKRESAPHPAGSTGWHRVTFDV